MSTFYSIDSTRFSHKEYWWGNRSPMVLIAWIIKWLRIQIPGSSDDPNVDSTLPFVVSVLPPDIHQRMTPYATQLAALGFTDPTYHIIRDVGTQTTVYWATFLHVDGVHIARIHNRVWQQAKVTNRGVFPLFYTGFDDGTFLVSSAGKPDMDAPAGVIMNRMYKAPVDKLWASHLKSVDALTGKSVLRVRTSADLVEMSERVHTLIRDFHIARGVFKARSVQDSAEADRFTSRVAQAEADGLEIPEVLAELERLQTSKPGWGNAIWILIFSIVAFLAAGSGQRNWKYTLILIPVLFFHEAGHWVAMKLCHYQNLRMFFIPMFGAAVTGRNWNVPGWKKVLVSLAGPVPGIILGSILAGVAIVLHQPSIHYVALVFLLLNAFNLLPILPLDGGHVLHATLFCRNRWLDASFRIVAVVGLLALSARTGGTFVFLAIVFATGVPVAFKLAKVTDKLRRENAPQSETEESIIPTATAQWIIAALRQEFTGPVSHKILAQHTLTVFEHLNARPPGTLATLALLGVHAGSILLAVVFAFVLLISGNGSFEALLRAATKPTSSYVCGSVQREPSGAPAVTGDLHHTLITTFTQRKDAERGFASLSPRIPTGARSVLFGDSILITIPAEDDSLRESWFKELHSLSTNTFVALTNSRVGMGFSAVASSSEAASNLVNTLNAYLSMGTPVIAPWAPEASDPGLMGALKTRLFWAQLDRDVTVPWSDARLQANQKQTTEALRRGAKAEVNRLTQAREVLVKELRKQAHEKIKSGRTDDIEKELIDLHQELEMLPYTNAVARTELLEKVALRVGPIPKMDRVRESELKSLGAVSGFANSEGATLHIRWMTFREPTQGVPAFAEWLCGQRCSDLRYLFHSDTLSSESSDSDEQ